MVDARYRATAIKAPHGASALEVTWADGHRQVFPHELLRGYCPCAGCQGHSGMITFVEGGDLNLRDIEQVGNYALGFTWADGHNTGIYSFRFLRALGELIATEGAQAVKDMKELPRL